MRRIIAMGAAQVLSPFATKHLSTMEESLRCVDQLIMIRRTAASVLNKNEFEKIPAYNDAFAHRQDNDTGIR